MVDYITTGIVNKAFDEEDNKKINVDNRNGNCDEENHSHHNIDETLDVISDEGNDLSDNIDEIFNVTSDEDNVATNPQINNDNTSYGYNSHEYDDLVNDCNENKNKDGFVYDGNEFEEDNLVRNKFSGVFVSLREKHKRKVWDRRSFKKYEIEQENEERETQLTPSRSQYSLVSQDLTAGALQLWLGLPEEVKYDPALAAFRQFYEKEQAQQESLPLHATKTSAPKVKRLPAVNSAPHLNNNERVSGDPHDQNGFVCFTQNSTAPVDAETQNHLIHGQKRFTKWDKARNYTKLTLLVGCWIFFTVVFCMFNEKEVPAKNCVLMPGQSKDYTLEIRKTELRLRVDLSGPFLSEQEQTNFNLTEKNSRSKVDVWIERWAVRDGDIKEPEDVDRENLVKPQSFLLRNANKLDFSEATQRSAMFEHRSSLNSTAVYVIRMFSNAAMAVPLTLSYQDSPIDVAEGVTYACLLLAMLYALIIFEIINRTLAAILVSTLSLAVLSIAGERPSMEQLVSWLDVETLLLLLSMMLLVAIMTETGMFDFLAVYTFQVTKGKTWPLIYVLCAITAALSTFLDNVTTVLLITPVTIKLCEVMEMHPVPVLTAIVLYSNVGGTATAVGDPPNVIISSNQLVKQSGINFANFTLHMTLGILLVCLQTGLQLRFMYRDVSKLRPSEPRDIQDLRRQLNVWRRAADSLPHMSKDELVVKERLERKVKKISAQLAASLKESNKRACPKDTFQRTLDELKKKHKIRDKGLLIKSCVAIGFVIVMFFLHAFPEFGRVSLGWTALLGAILLLILADREDIDSILRRVEWSTLLFFAALFVLMEALTKLGLIDYIGGLTEGLIMKVEETHRLAVALLLIVWISGVTSAFVDNVPLATMMVRVVTSLGTNPTLGLPLKPLIWALSFGVCLGGNGTLIGASANVVCAGVSEQHGYKFTFMQFFRIGFPIMIGHLVVASGYLIVCHCLLTWH